VAVAHEGSEALALAPRFSPEIALLDLGRSEIDGYELGARLRAGDAQVRLIAVSGYGDPASRARSLAAGFEAHVVKPVRGEELGALFERVLLAEPAAG
jgi:CheY-like chemotaxis protein